MRATADQCERTRQVRALFGEPQRRVHRRETRTRAPDPLGVPVLVIFGAADRRWDPSSAHQYTTVPNARVEQLPDVGHFPMLEAPEATGELLLRFAANGR
ncbi:alpha/beta fold hydrolase [Streptomyces sp. NBC_00015]|uniref:alpha/beta fold hydrolase n=1 Tax=Streptomyces sp. NBC_00015 TaxID=2903611 RepID=UPI002F907DBE